MAYQATHALILQMLFYFAYRWHSRKGENLWHSALLISVNTSCRLLMLMQLWHTELSVNRGYGWQKSYTCSCACMQMVLFV